MVRQFKFSEVRNDFVREYEGLEKRYKVYSTTSKSLIEFAGIKGTDLVIDLGCGTGISSLEIYDTINENGKLIGVDISNDMLYLAKKRLSGKKNVQFRMGNAYKLSNLFEEKADVILSNFTYFYFLSDLDSLFKQAYNALKQGGKYVFNIPPFMVPTYFKGEEYNKFTRIVFSETDKILKENGYNGRGVPAVDTSLVDKCDKPERILRGAGFSSIESRVTYLPLKAGDWLDFILTYLRRGDTTYFSTELMRIPLENRIKLIEGIFDRCKQIFLEQKIDESPAIFEICAIKR